MTDSDLLNQVKKALNITGTYQDDTLTVYIKEVKGFMKSAGIPQCVIESEVAVGCIARGVSDLWAFGAGTGKLSDYFRLRMLQLRIDTSDIEEGEHNG